MHSVNFKLDCKTNELLQEIFQFGLGGVFLNFTIALRIFLSLFASIASGERFFTFLRQVRNYQFSSIGQDRLNGLTQKL
jgi:hypothetical protein